MTDPNAAILDDQTPMRLSPAARRAAAGISQSLVRQYVDAYYQSQRQRIRADHHMREEGQDAAAEVLSEHFSGMAHNIERQYVSVLNAYAQANPVGRWSLSIVGIGPVIAAGLLAHIDITRSTNVGKLWRYAGQDPTTPRSKKGEKNRYNVRLKTLVWKVGQSFVKVSNNDRDVYGKVYQARKQQEIARNEAGLFVDQAVEKLRTANIRKDTEAYKWYSQGKLPPAHIQARAERYARKLFLSHWHYVAFASHFGVPPEEPYGVSLNGHGHFVQPPNWPMD